MGVDLWISHGTLRSLVVVLFHLDSFRWTRFGVTLGFSRCVSAIVQRDSLGHQPRSFEQEKCTSRSFHLCYYQCFWRVNNVGIRMIVQLSFQMLVFSLYGSCSSWRFWIFTSCLGAAYLKVDDCWLCSESDVCCSNDSNEMFRISALLVSLSPLDILVGSISSTEFINGCSPILSPFRNWLKSSSERHWSLLLDTLVKGDWVTNIFRVLVLSFQGSWYHQVPRLGSFSKVHHVMWNKNCISSFSTLTYKTTKFRKGIGFC